METESPMPAELPGYYRSALTDQQALASITDLDDYRNFKEFEREVCSPKTRNFVIDFSDEEAWGAVNLSAGSIEELLQSSRPSRLNTRWINIWLPYQQREVLSVLAKHYDFTPRLYGLMLSTPAKTKASSASTSRHSGRSRHSGESFKSRFASHCSEASKASSVEKSVLDIKLGAEEKIGMVTMEDLAKADLVRNLNQYLLADDIWHYSSVDWGRRYMCLGYNALHVVDSHENSSKPHQDMPHGKRVWNWLLLGEEKTIITISEDPFPGTQGVLTMREQRALGSIRRNLIHVFRQCSKAYVAPDELAATQLPIRRRLGDSEEETLHRSSDVPGLLFYYLFDDSFGTYSLIARRQNRYATELNQIRLSMLSKAELGHIDRLHHIGRQLAVLKRIYQGYDMIIDRLLEKREPSLASLKASQAFATQLQGGGVVVLNANDAEPDDDDGGAATAAAASCGHARSPPMIASQPGLLADSQFLMGVSLSSAARVRFERLKHNIKLYALSEIDECLAQKDALVMMNFNLIAIKESFSVERLTRITLLLAKATLLFMPISVMTAYFSTQLVDARFTVRSYWSWFAAIATASVVALLMFNIVSGAPDTEIVYLSWSRRAWNAVARAAGRVVGRSGRKAGEEEDEGDGEGEG